MPIYACTIRDGEKTRIVRAATAAQARNHVVDAKAITADELAEALDGGAKIETAAVSAAED